MNRLKREPAVLLGVLAGLASAGSTALAQSTNGTGAVNWLTLATLLIPAVAGVLVRNAVVPLEKVERVIGWTREQTGRVTVTLDSIDAATRQ